MQKYSFAALLLMLVASGLLFTPGKAAAQSQTYTCSDGTTVSIPASAPGGITGDEACANNGGEYDPSCAGDQEKRLLGIVPKWYKYLPYEPDNTGRCAVHIDFSDNAAGILPIGLAVIEMLLAIAGVVAVAFVMVGGFRYMTSQGEPEHTKAAQSTIINALIGGTVCLIATALVNFIGSRFN